MDSPCLCFRIPLAVPRRDTASQTKEKTMTPSQGDMIALLIVLGVNLLLMFITAYANIYLIKENRFLKARLKAWRRDTNHHTTWED